MMRWNSHISCVKICQMSITQSVGYSLVAVFFFWKFTCLCFVVQTFLISICVFPLFMNCWLSILLRTFSFFVSLVSWLIMFFVSAVTSSFNYVYFSVSCISKIYIKVTFAGCVNFEAVFWHTNVMFVDVHIGIYFFSTYAMTDKHPNNFVQIVIDNSLALEDITVFIQMLLSFNITTERLDKNITEGRHILIYRSFYFCTSKVFHMDGCL